MQLNENEVLYEVKTYVIKTFCECGGEMEYKPGIVESLFNYDCGPYSHACKKCGKIIDYNSIYPRTVADLQQVCPKPQEAKVVFEETKEYVKRMSKGKVRKKKNVDEPLPGQIHMDEYLGKPIEEFVLLQEGFVYNEEQLEDVRNSD